MPIPSYGVWRATPTSFTVERSDVDDVSPHGHLFFKDNVSTTPKPLSSAINVKSRSSDSRLVYWMLPDFQHPLTQKLDALSPGYHRIQPNSDLAIDYLRSNLFRPEAGLPVPHDLPGANNDIVDVLEPFMLRAIQADATVFLYGSQYNDKTGIHNVHMNQGSAPPFTNSNGVFNDGGVVFKFPDGHWEAFFIAFASQAMKTDANGDADGITFGEFFANRPPVAPPPDSEDVPADDDDRDEPPTVSSVRIAAALVNPIGPDNNPQPELVYLVNTSASVVSLAGWTIGNHRGDTFTLPAGSELLANGHRLAFKVPGVPLSNKGGGIILRNKQQIVSQVRYTEKQASRAGSLIMFG